MFGALIAAAVAWGDPGCEPVDARSFAFTQQLAAEAIANDRLDEHSGLISALERQIPCFVFVPAPEVWADLLVGMAIVAFAKDDPAWTLPLQTALEIHPQVDRRVGPSHPIHDWEPEPALPRTGRSIPEGVRVYIDGELVSEVPALAGLHLVQRRTGDGLETLLLRDGALPSVWLTEAPLARARPVRVALDVGGGYGAGDQAVEVEGDWLRPGASAGVEGAMRALATWRPVGPLALRAEARAGWPGRRPSVDAAVTVGLGNGWIAGGVGLAVTDVAHQTAEGQPLTWVFAPALALALRPPGDANVEFSARGAALPGLSSGAASVAVEPGRTLVRPRFGAEIAASRSWWTQGGRAVVLSEWTVGAFAGVAWGRS